MKNKFIFACFLIGAIHISSYVKAQTKDELLDGATNGDAQSMIQLAEGLLKGYYGLERNASESLRWYKKAAHKADPEAQYMVSKFYFLGWGANKDVTKGVAWLQKSANNKYDKACIELGRMYQHGRLVERKPAKAFKLYLSAANRNDVLAQRMVGKCYLKGIGTPLNFKMAKSWFERSAAGGNALAMYRIGYMYKKGYGVPKDNKKAVKWFKRGGLDRNNDQARYALAYMTYKGFGTKQNYQQAVELFKESASKGNRNSQFMLGLCYQKGHGVKKDLDRAMAYYEKSAKGKKGNRQARMKIQKLKNKDKNGFGRIETNDKNASDHIGTEEILSDAQKRIKEKTPDNYSEITTSNQRLALDGVWIGRLVTYDWSGQEIESTTPVAAEISVTGDQTKGWLQINDSVTVSLQGTVSGNTLKFTDRATYKQAIWDYPIPIVLQIKEALFESEFTADSQLLKANLTIYNPMEQETHNPTMLILEKASTVEFPNEVRVFPNPFKDIINVNYTLGATGSTNIELYNLMGAKIMSLQKGSEEAGEKWHSFSPSLEDGVYFVRVFSNGKLLINKKIIKN